jgi:hypothetical protein
VKLAALLVLVCACERADKAPPPKPPVPTPDPVKQAREEFELIPGDYARTHVSWHRDYFVSVDNQQKLGGGDFIGRLRMLFGPTADNEYTLRHKPTGYVIAAGLVEATPEYYVGPRYPGALPPVEALDATDNDNI